VVRFHASVDNEKKNHRKRQRRGKDEEADRRSLPALKLAALREHKRASEARSRLRKTEEQRIKELASNAAAMRKWRSRQTDEELASNAAAKRKRRSQQTDEERRASRQQHAGAEHSRVATLTEAEADASRTANTTAHQAARRQSYAERNFEERFEVDQHAAKEKFCSMSGLQHLYKAKWKPEEFKAEIEKQLSDSMDIKERLADDWNKSMMRTPEQPIRGCASCGRAKRTTKERSIDVLEIFLLSDAQRRDYNSLAENDKAFVTVYTAPDGRLYALHARFMAKAGVFTLCDSCIESICRDTLPRYSVANGYDFGDVRALGALTVAEETLIAWSFSYASEGR
jgi:hypothetical protein